MKAYLFFIVTKLFRANEVMNFFTAKVPWNLRKVRNLIYVIFDNIFAALKSQLNFNHLKSQLSYFYVKKIFTFDSLHAYLRGNVEVYEFFYLYEIFYVNELSPLFDKVHKFYRNTKVREHYPEREYIAEIQECIVLGGTRAIISNDGKFLHDENSTFNDHFDADIKDDLLKYKKNLFYINVRSRGFLRKVDNGINLMNKYNVNYFHFVTETVPKIILINEKFRDKKIPFIFENDLHKNIREIITNLNIYNRPIIYLERHELYFFKKLIVCSDLALIVDNYFGGNSKNKTYINKLFLKKFVMLFKTKYSYSNESKHKYFVSRMGSYRNILNIKQVNNLLQQNRFEIINPLDLNISQQISVFSKASLIITSSGAHITNIIWMNKGANVIILISNHPAHQQKMWMQLADVSGVNIHFIIGKTRKITDFFNKYGVHADYEVDPKLILAKLKEIS